MRRSTTFLSTLCLSLLAMTQAGVGQTPLPVPRPAPSANVVRIARSADGLTFRDTGQVVALNASAPALARLPDGRLLAVFDYAGGSAEGTTALVVSGSRNEGKSWSRPRPIRFGRFGPPPSARCAHAALVAMPGGRVRLYFVATERGGDTRNEGTPHAAAILCAAMQDGPNCTLDPAVRIPIQGAADPHPVIVQVGSEIHLFVGDAQAGRGDALQHFISDDGRLFRAGPPLQSPDSLLVCSFVPIGKALRAYGSANDGVRSVMSSVGLAWETRTVACLYGGHDPAVAQLRDGTWLMLYRSRSDSRGHLAARGAPDDEEAPRESGASAVDEARTGGRRISAANLKVVAVACLTYSRANQGNLPPDLDTLVRNGAVSEKVLISPLENSDSTSYVYIRGQKNVLDPRNVIVYERPENYGNDGTNVLFLDGHVEWMRADAFEKALGDTRERLGRSGESARGKRPD